MPMVNDFVQCTHICIHVYRIQAEQKDDDSFSPYRCTWFMQMTAGSLSKAALCQDLRSHQKLKLCRKSWLSTTLVLNTARHARKHTKAGSRMSEVNDSCVPHSDAPKAKIGRWCAGSLAPQCIGLFCSTSVGSAAR